jgi:hypothetical protein
LLIRTRQRPFVEARQLTHLILRDRTNYSLAEIGVLVGGYDHATVLHSARVWANLIDTSRPHRKRYSEVNETLDAAMTGAGVETVKGLANQRTIRNWNKYKHEFYTIEYSYELKVS